MELNLNNDPYRNVICNYFAKLLPGEIKLDAGNLMDVISRILMGDKQLRYGPLPQPEIQVNIRNVVRKCIEAKEPIPVLIPWGGRKMQKGLLIDIAEISALQQITRVIDAVEKLYEPGLDIIIRVEDANALWLYEQPKISSVSEDASILDYTQGMITWGNSILQGKARIMPETELMNEQEYYMTAKNWKEHLYMAIMEKVTTPEKSEYLRHIQSLGWKGNLDIVQISYYLDRYQMLYPHYTLEQRVEKLAGYFAGSIARYELNGRGSEHFYSTAGFIQANLSHPVPSAPNGIFGTTVYWRTVPMSEAKTHIAPWRAKGFLSINPENEIDRKLVGMGDTKSMHTVIGTLEGVEMMVHYYLDEENLSS